MNPRLLATPLVLVFLGACGPNATDKGDAGDTGGTTDPELENAAMLLGVLLGSDPADEEIRQIIEGAVELRRDNPHLFGDCTEQTPVDPDLDAVWAFSGVLSGFDTSAKWASQCGMVDGAYVACAPDMLPLPAGDIVVTGYVVAGKVDYTTPQIEMQLSTPLRADGEETWQAIEAYPCDYWRYFSMFPHVWLTSDAAGMPTGTFNLSTAADGTILSTGTWGRGLVFENTVLLLTPQEDLPQTPTRFAIGHDGRSVGRVPLWLGGDREPDVREDTDVSPGLPLLRF